MLADKQPHWPNIAYAAATTAITIMSDVV